MNIKKGNQLLLIFDEDKVHLSYTKSIDKSKVEVSRTLIVNAGVKWKISVIRYIPEEKRIFAEIINYQSNEDYFSTIQIETIDKNEVDRINFKTISTNGLLSSSSPKKTITKPENRTKNPDKWNKPKLRPIEFNTPERNVKALIKEVKISFDFPIKYILFLNGYVEFTKFVKEVNREVKFAIQNPAIKEEYDSIKNYFERFLKRKTISVKANIKFTIKEIIDCTAVSDEITKINESAVESVVPAP